MTLAPYIDQSSYKIPPNFSLERGFNLFRAMGLSHVTVVDTNNHVRLRETDPKRGRAIMGSSNHIRLRERDPEMGRGPFWGRRSGGLKGKAGLG